MPLTFPIHKSLPPLLRFIPGCEETADFESCPDLIADKDAMRSRCRSVGEYLPATLNYEGTPDVLSESFVCRYGYVIGQFYTTWLLYFWNVLTALLLGVCLMVTDVVKATDHHSTCFTKAYTHYAEGTGSALQTCESIDVRALSPEFSVLFPCPDSHRFCFIYTTEGHDLCIACV
jgi:hypothetical protein